MGLSEKRRLIFGATTEPGVNKLAFCYHLWFISPNVPSVVLLGSWALGYQHVIAHHLGAPRTEAHSGVDELRVLMLV